MIVDLFYTGSLVVARQLARRAERYVGIIWVMSHECDFNVTIFC